MQFKIEFVQDNDPIFAQDYMNHWVLEFGSQNLFVTDDNILKLLRLHSKPFFKNT